MSQSNEDAIGVEVGYLAEQAVAWYDHRDNRSDVAYEIFGMGEQQLYVRRLPGSSDLQVELATQGHLWSRTSECRWKLKDNLTLRERFQRSVLIEHAEKLVQESMTVRLSRATEEETCDLQVATAIALGAPFQLIPTFDSKVFELVDKNLLCWESVRPLLMCFAEVALLGSEQSEEITGVSVRSGPHTWLRYRGSWLPVERKPDHEPILLPLAFHDLVEAVLIWDVTENAKAPLPRRQEFPGKSLYFVSPDDPGDVPDFSIQGLVRGSVDTGHGESRRTGAWERGYWPVLNIENHMPTDEGDLPPWGGQYLCSVEKGLEPFAIKFWDSTSASTLNEDRGATSSDFAKWIATQT